VAHVPHVFIPRPWPPDTLALPVEAERHLRKVLRRDGGTPISYTDGEGVVGESVFADGRVARDGERSVALPRPEIVVAAAPPRSTDRIRFLIEKASELGVAEVWWLATRHGEGRPPRRDKARAWAIGALEQSRGAWLTAISDAANPISPVELAATGGDEAAPVVFAHPGAAPLRETVARLGSASRIVVVVGPEGGSSGDELPPGAALVGLGEAVLRVETAAIAAVAAIRLG